MAYPGRMHFHSIFVTIFLNFSRLISLYTNNVGLERFWNFPIHQIRAHFLLERGVHLAERHERVCALTRAAVLAAPLPVGKGAWQRCALRQRSTLLKVPSLQGRDLGIGNSREGMGDCRSRGERSFAMTSPIDVITLVAASLGQMDVQDRFGGTDGRQALV